MAIMAEVQPRPVRALRFTRGAGELGAVQRELLASVCVARGWEAGPVVRDFGPGFRAWTAVIRLVLRGGCDLVMVTDAEDIAPTESGMVAVLRMLARAGVRLLIVSDGIDTGDPIGRDLVGSLLAGAV